jgi:hypothetical protein
MASADVDPHRIVPSITGMELMTVRWEFDSAWEVCVVLNSTMFGATAHPVPPGGDVGVWLMNTIPCTSPPHVLPGSSMNQRDGTEI